MGQDQLMSDADVFGAPQSPPPNPLYYDNGRGISVQVGGAPASMPSPAAAPAPQAQAPDLMSDADVFGGGPLAQPTGAKPNFALGLYQGLMKPLDNAARGAEWGLTKLGVPMEAIDRGLGQPTAQDATDAHAAFVARQAMNGMRPGPWGRFAGEVAGTVPATIGMGPLAAGAATGALLSDAKSLGGLAFDAAAGAAGGKVADYGLNAVKSAVSPTISDAVRTLLGEGVGLTPGQILGGTMHRLEDGATSIPILGDIIKNAQGRSLTDFNRAAINRALSPVGQALPKDLPAGHDAIDFAHRALSDAYDGMLPGLQVHVDPEFHANVADLRKLAQNLTPDYARKFETILQNEVVGRFAPQTGVMTGQTMKEVESTLGQQATRFGKVQDGHAQDYADAVRELQAQLRGLVERSNPQAAKQLQAINGGWANLVRVENAASRQGATGGVFTPSQLQGAVRAGDNSVRKNATARGGALMQDLATAGKEVLPSSVPDSGSPFRHALEAAVALLVGKEANMMPLLIKGGVAGGLVGGAYTRGGQKIVTPLLTARPAAAKATANLLAKLKTPVMQAGGAAAITARQAGSN